MSKTLVLAEKPSVGRELARVLKCNKKGNGYLEGEKYIVTWALGHLVTLADPEVYDDKYKQWKLDTLPMLPKELKLVVIKQSGKQFAAVKSQITRKDVNEIIIATDAGREGELVARWIIEKANVKKPMKRLWISSQTDKAIIEGFRNLKPSSNYDNLYKAAQCRAEADWVVGLNVTRALTCKHNAQLTAGRVQSATLAMIVNREEEIRNFKPKDYYVINAKAKGFNLQWRDKNNNTSVFEESIVNKVLSATKGKEGNIVSVTETAKKQYAPLLYDLTELQRDANRIFGYSAKQTLSIMQRLYENYKVLTYPRTDSRYVSTDIVATLPDRLKAISVGSYRALATEILNGKINANKSFVDNSKVSDHHAIIPTEERGNIALLSSEERRVYDLVVKRFLSVMLPPYEYLQTTVTADINGETFVARGNVIKSKGWKKVYDKVDELTEDEDEKDSQVLPVVKKGDKLNITLVESRKLKTKAPARFNEGTLLSAMEKPQKYVSVDKVSAKTLGETGGIGTVATRADIIEKLYNSFYMEKSGKEIIPTSKGKQLIELVPEDLKSPLLTAQWELELDLISKGKKDPKVFTDNMRKYATELVSDVKGSSEKFKHDNLTGKKCPECGKYMLEVKGKYGIMNVCQDRACGHRENVSKITNARCPDCKKKLELRGQGDGQIYICANKNCNFREKASQFNKRFDNKNDKANKKEVSNIMKQMKKEANEPINNPFAALGDLFKK
ncbi:DNA topoisomerase III [Clostridium algidicarnis]|uniref:DNA topoisomerase 3 n=1 Tax=Clostridium algidicarnis TaxID=37659 RepID=A0ABS6C3X3_9CLOT|nr:DNA topoisomerase III [Clostridium algidicarnis]MBB6631047.1 DNA topoisomerase III [Clostridium algidicarnis]MBB6698225.1 DNA topoisomerase III [Clostridium algidicarnis]MBU3197134.1 DNA topoisomerase III [Clostridium algidicarnis]MBU3220197.1 DNA topoisomerase III [Clostridium algidicarnis]MCB2286889.1 DNA topoisomerase III [Clostridium algidicarnis]